MIFTNMSQSNELSLGAKQRQAALQNIIKEKGKKEQNYINQIQQLQKENQKIISMHSHRGAGFERVNDLTTKLQVSQKQNEEYRTEISVLKRIQNEQSKALQKVMMENSYTQKINGLLEDVKYWKQRFKDVESELKKDKNTIKELLFSRQDLLEEIRNIKKKPIESNAESLGGNEGTLSPREPDIQNKNGAGLLQT